MNTYNNYIKEIEERKHLGLHPKPVDSAELLNVLIDQIKDVNNEHRAESLDFFIYNVLPGTTNAARGKADYLKYIILGIETVKEISPEFAFEQLSHMKGGPSIDVLLDLVLGSNESIAKKASEVMKTQVFLYEADMERIKVAHENGLDLATDLLKSYAQAEFFYKIT
jgi:aconitate hydratase 2/2-methylisocitrate dehydratase